MRIPVFVIRSYVHGDYLDDNSIDTFNKTITLGVVGWRKNFQVVAKLCHKFWRKVCSTISQKAMWGPYLKTVLSKNTWVMIALSIEARRQFQYNL